MTGQTERWPTKDQQNTVRGAACNMGLLGRTGKGPGGDCVCPECGVHIEHQKGVPCKNTICGNCGVNMERVVDLEQVSS